MSPRKPELQGTQKEGWTAVTPRQGSQIFVGRGGGLGGTLTRRLVGRRAMGQASPEHKAHNGVYALVVVNAGISISFAGEGDRAESILCVAQPQNTRTYNQKENHSPMAVWGTCPQRWYPTRGRGLHIDLWTPSPSAKERLQPRRNVQSMVHLFYSLTYFKGTPRSRGVPPHSNPAFCQHHI